jgi:hypothetical protein
MERNEDCHAAKNGEVICTKIICFRFFKIKILSCRAQDFFWNMGLFSFTALLYCSFEYNFQNQVV